MSINLKKTDVVIVGMGAAGGVAALPLARAGLEVIGLEAGGWLVGKEVSISLEVEAILVPEPAAV